MRFACQLTILENLEYMNTDDCYLYAGKGGVGRPASYCFGLKGPRSWLRRQSEALNILFTDDPKNKTCGPECEENCVHALQEVRKRSDEVKRM